MHKKIIAILIAGILSSPILLIHLIGDILVYIGYKMKKFNYLVNFRRNLGKWAQFKKESEVVRNKRIARKLYEKTSQ